MTCLGGLEIKNVIRSWIGRCVLLAALASGGVEASESPSPTDAVRVVAHLYKAYAWQAMASAGPTSELFGKPLTDEPSSVLEAYFDTDLVTLIVRDARCRDEHRGEVCRLDFDPIFASQDSAATDLEIQPGQHGHVAVSFSYPGAEKPVHLDYVMTRTAAGWRITDIVYPDLKSARLRRILSAKL